MGAWCVGNAPCVERLALALGGMALLGELQRIEGQIWAFRAAPMAASAPGSARCFTAGLNGRVLGCTIASHKVEGL